MCLPVKSTWRPVDCSTVEGDVSYKAVVEPRVRYSAAAVLHWGQFTVIQSEKRPLSVRREEAMRGYEVSQGRELVPVDEEDCGWDVGSVKAGCWDFSPIQRANRLPKTPGQ